MKYDEGSCIICSINKTKKSFNREAMNIMTLNVFQRNLLNAGYIVGAQETSKMYVFVSPVMEDPHLVVTIEEDYDLAEVHSDIAFVFGDLVNRYNTDKILFVVFTKNTQDAERLTRNHFRCWLYNTTYDQLEIREGQPTVFYNVRALLLQTYEHVSAPKKAPKRVYIKRIHNVFNFTNLFILINLIVHIILFIKGDTTDVEFMVENGAFYPEAFSDGEIYRIFTSMFMHFDWLHIAGNMFVLFLVGRNLENMIGKIKFPILYIVSGLGAGTIAGIYYFIAEKNVVCVGASGAVYGVVGALLWAIIINKNRRNEMVLWQIIAGLVLSLGGGFAAEEGVSVAAHIGGFICGFLLSLCMYRGPKKEELS